jgi:hypothetical protein
LLLAAAAGNITVDSCSGLLAPLLLLVLALGGLGSRPDSLLLLLLLLAS